MNLTNNTASWNVFTVENVNRTVAQVGATVADIQSDVRHSAHIATIMRLAYADGATWDIGKGCQDGTREPIIAEIMNWIEDFCVSDAAGIFCLAAAPGAGKTTIAHSVAKFCADKGWLATAFFFNREVSTQGPMLFSTIACDLAARFPIFKTSISQSIEQDPSLGSASV